MSISITREMMDFLIALDTSRSEGHPWQEVPAILAGVRNAALGMEWIEANTIDGEPTVYRITEDGQKAMINGVVSDGPVDAAAVSGKRPSASHLALLSALVEAQNKGDGWLLSKSIPLETVPYYTRQMAQDRGWIEARGNAHHREFKITVKGLAVFQYAPLANDGFGKTSRLSEAEKQQRIDESKARIATQLQIQAIPQEAASTPVTTEFGEEWANHAAAEPAKAEYTDPRFKDTFTDEDKKKISEAVRRSMPIVIEPSVTHSDVFAHDTCASRCADCFYRDAIELLEKRVPGVREIVGGLKTIHGQK